VDGGEGDRQGREDGGQRRTRKGGLEWNST